MFKQTKYHVNAENNKNKGTKGNTEKCEKEVLDKEEERNQHVLRKQTKNRNLRCTDKHIIRTKNYKNITRPRLNNHMNVNSILNYHGFVKKQFKTKNRIIQKH